jgi:hypothetical protein
LLKVASDKKFGQHYFEESPVSFMKMLLSCLLKSIKSVKYFESDFLENIYIYIIQCSVNCDDYASQFVPEIPYKSGLCDPVHLYMISKWLQYIVHNGTRLFQNKKKIGDFLNFVTSF